jgi:hypothetical protein
MSYLQELWEKLA